MADADLTSHLTMASKLLDAGNPSGAEAHLKIVLAANPSHPQAHRLMALRLLKDKRLAEAEKEARLALTLEPENPNAHYILGVVCQNYLKPRKNREAERCYLEALKLSPENPVYMKAMARLLKVLKRSKEALAYLERAMRVAPDDPDALAMLGNFKLSQGNTETAEQFARDALALDPEHTGAHNLMGRLALHYRGDLEEAREHVFWSLSQDSRDPEALYLLSGIKARKSWWLGLWWRYHSWALRRGQAVTLLTLAGAYVMVRLVNEVSKTSNSPWVNVLAGCIIVGWLVWCLYSWFGAKVFQRMLKKELRTVTLKRNF